MSAIRAGRAYVELFADPTKLEQGLAQGAKRMENFAKGVSALGRQMATIGAAITAPLLGAVAVFAKSGDELHKMSIRAGVSVEGLSELRFAAEQSGASLEGLNGVLSRMRRTIGEAAAGGKTQADNLARLGLSAQELQQLKPEEQLGLIADRLNALASEEDRAAVAAQLLGRSWEQIDPLLRGGSAGIDGLREQARKLGLTVSTEAAEAAAEFSDQMNILRRITAMATFQVGGALVPVLTEYVKWAQDAAQRTVGWIKENQDLIRTFFQIGFWVGSIGAGMLVLAKAITTVATVARGAAVAIGALRVALTFLVAHPAIAGLSLLAAGATAVALSMRRARDSTRELAEEASRLRRETDQMIDSDRAALQRLVQLERQQRLTNAEKEEAIRLLTQLRTNWGDVGIQIDDVTGKITGAAAAWRDLNASMQEQAILMAEDELEKTKDAIAPIQKGIDGLNRALANHRRQLSESGFEGSSITRRYREQLEEATEALNRFERRRDALEREIEARRRLRDGDAGTATGGVGSVGGGGGEDEREQERTRDAIEQWERRLAEIQIQRIEDAYERERALIDERYKYELDAAADNIEHYIAIERAMREELAALDERYERDRAEAARRESERLADEEQRRRDQVEHGDKDESRRVEELRLRALYEEFELERALLDLREKHALEDAQALGRNLDLVRERYAIERQILGLREEEARNRDGPRDQLGAAGTFAAQHVGQILGRFAPGGSPSAGQRIQEQKDKAGEETARNTKETVEAIKDLAAQTRRGRGLHFT